MTGRSVTVVGVAGFGTAMAAGFAVRPRRVRPLAFTADRGSVTLPPDLPPWMRLGRSPWLPPRMHTLHRVGHGFASDVSLTSRANHS
jgi:hypothetical protein